jgi:hypothetical protein
MQYKKDSFETNPRSKPVLSSSWVDKAAFFLVLALMLQGFFYVQADLKLSYNKTGKYIWKDPNASKQNESIFGKSRRDASAEDK